MNKDNLKNINSKGWTIFGILGGIAVIAASSIISLIKNNKDFINDKQKQFVGMSVMFSEFIKKSKENISKESKKIEQFLKQKVNDSAFSDMGLLINELISKKSISPETFAKFYSTMNYSVRLQMFRLLVNSQKNKAEYKEMNQSFIEIAQMLNLEKKDYQSVIAVYNSDLQSAYLLLQIDRDAPPEEIKASFRRLSKIHHPDKVEHLGEEYRREAAENFQNLLHAYELIKKERKI
ncbi:MAG: J domain-containing protein [Bacteroidales bacterium]|nr:J domain-containing protein [Bacteroidales bacterium]